MADSDVKTIVNLVFAELVAIDSTILTGFGRREAEKFAGHHRVVAVPLGAPQILEGNHPGGGKWDLTPGNYSNVDRQLYRRMFEIEWHCHDSDDGLTETLFKNTLRSVRKVTHAAVEFSDEQWVEQKEGADSFERFGNVIVFKSMIQINLYKAAPVSVVLTADPPIATTVTLTNT